jgi:uncharacterized delta-60 repeat protein
VPHGSWSLNGSWSLKGDRVPTRSRRLIAALVGGAAAAAIAVATPALATVGGMSATAAPGGPSGSTATPTPGTLDPGFGQGGIVALPAGAAPPNAVLLQPDGKIVAAGIHCTNQPARGACQSPEQIGVARLNTNGSLDTTFGTGGAVTIAAGVDVDPLIVQPDGKILITWDEGSGSTPMLARLLG